MKRFTRAYFTSVVLVVLAANLVLILLYGRQFLFTAESTCIDCTVVKSQANLYLSLLWLNTILVIVFALIWYVLNLLLPRRPKQ